MLYMRQYRKDLDKNMLNGSEFDETVKRKLGDE